jgi:hypothetical protein
MTFTRLWPTYFYHVYFWFGQEWHKVFAFKIFYWNSFCNLINKFFLSFMFLWIIDPTLLDTKILLQMQFHILQIWKIVECYGGWKLLLTWHANAKVYTFSYVGLRLWAYCVYTLLVNGWFYLWSRGEELASLNPHFLFSYPWRFRVHHNEAWSWPMWPRTWVFET